MDSKKISEHFLEIPETQVEAHQTYLASKPKLRFLQIVTVRQYLSAVTFGV